MGLVERSRAENQGVRYLPCFVSFAYAHGGWFALAPSLRQSSLLIRFPRFKTSKDCACMCVCVFGTDFFDLSVCILAPPPTLALLPTSLLHFFRCLINFVIVLRAFSSILFSRFDTHRDYIHIHTSLLKGHRMV